MAKIGIFCDYDSRVTNDALFQEENEYLVLKQSLESNGHEMRTLDVFKKNNIEPDICLFLDIPRKHITHYLKCSAKKILLIREPKNILIENWNESRWVEFDKVLTWSKKLVLEKGFIHIPSTKIFFDKQISSLSNNARKLCCLINSNLSSNVNGELYTERRRVVKWFEDHNPDDFDLYGYGWDELRIFFRNRRIFKSRLLAPKIKTYKGVAANKIEKLREYKFTICFENTSIIEDYVSEKIFDAFCAETIPIYFGAPNICEWIPKECFIDFREFKDYESLYIMISQMPQDEYEGYILAIRNFMRDIAPVLFSMQKWGSTILDVIEETLEN